MSRSPARTLDANANRAREAARTLEDIARFVLDRADLAATLKEARHAVTSAIEAAGFDRLELLAARDTAGDTGTGTTTAAETDRATLRSIADAASGRLSEALRVIEETLKLSDARAAAVIEASRYATYDAAAAVCMALGTGRATQRRLCVLVTESLCVDRPWLEVAEAALRGGADSLQLREKDISDRELLSRARELVSLCRAHGAESVINDRADIAALAGADSVHVGQTDLGVRDLRAVVGGRVSIGVSCASIEQARDAVRDGADSLGLGPIFTSSTKPKPALSGLGLLEAVLADTLTRDIPHLAISGIGAHNAGELVAVGCRGVAVSSAVCGADDPEAAARAIAATLHA